MKRAVSFIMAICLALGCSACNASGQQASATAVLEATPSATPEVTQAPTPEAVRHRMAFVASAVGDDTQMMLDKGIGDAMRAYGADYYSFGPQDGEAATQVTLINSLLQRDIEGLVIRPVDAESLKGAVEQAQSQGVKVVVIEFEPSDLGDIRVSGVDKTRQAQDMVETLSAQLDGKGKFVLFSAKQGNEDTQPIVDGIQQTLQQSEYAQLQLVDVVYDEAEDGEVAKQRIGGYINPGAAETATPTPDASQEEATPTPGESTQEATPDASETPDTSGATGESPDQTPVPQLEQAVDAVVCLTTRTTEAAANAISSAKMQDSIYLMGSGRPSLLSKWVESEVCKLLYVTSSYDTGMLAGYTAHKLVNGDLTAQAGNSFFSGRVGERTIGQDDMGLYVEVAIPSKVDAVSIETWKKIW